MRSNREAGTHTHRHQLPQSINFVLSQRASLLTCVRDCQLWPLHKLINNSKHPDGTSFLTLIDKNVSLLSIIKALLTLWLSPIDKHVGVLSMLFHKKKSNFYTNQHPVLCLFLHGSLPPPQLEERLKGLQLTPLAMALIGAPLPCQMEVNLVTQLEPTRMRCKNDRVHKTTL